MKARTYVLTLLVGTFAPGCLSPSLWQDPLPITSSSYSIAEGSMQRSVGRLRKLVLAPAHVHVVLPFFEGHSVSGAHGRVGRRAPSLLGR